MSQPQTNLLNIIPDDEGVLTVSARELYTFLEASERFGNWFERQLQYGFIEDVDYVGCKVFNTLANQLLDDFALKMDCAKEIAMVQRSEKGKQARQYFIVAEKRYRQQTSLTPATVSRRDMAMMILDAEAEIDRLNKEVEQCEKVIVSQSKKVAYVDEVLTAKNSLLVTNIAKDLGMSAMALNELLHKLNVQYKQGDQWVLYSQYQNKGYTETETFPYKSNSTGTVRTSHLTKWTELGRAFIVKKVTDYRNRQLAIQSASTSPAATA